MKLCFSFLSNILGTAFSHSLLYKVFTNVIQSKALEISKVAIFKKAQILAFITQEIDKADYTHPSKLGSTIKKGHIAYLYKLASLLRECKDEKVQELIYEDRWRQKWTQFCEGPLLLRNEQENHFLGGKDPRKTDFVQDLHSAIGPISYMPSDIESIQHFKIKENELEKSHIQQSVEDVTFEGQKNLDNGSRSNN